MPTPASPRKNRLPALGFVSLVVLTAQFLLGMDAALFFKFPETGSRWAAASSGLVGVHVILGSLMVLFAIVLLVLAIRGRKPRWLIASIVGLVGIGAAWYFGTLFVQADSDPASYLMSCGFALAFLGYGWGLWAGERT